MRMHRQRFEIALLGLFLLGAVGLHGSSASGEDVSVCEAASLPAPALGICQAYCEAQSCHSAGSPSCEQLRERFQRAAGTDLFPCDPVCGDGEVNQVSEQCDPPGGRCEATRVCKACRCILEGLDTGCEGGGCSSGDDREPPGPGRGGGDG